MSYIEAKQIEEMKNSVQFILDTAEYYINPTPGHPRGCAREAWLSQAQYWMEKLDEFVPGVEGTMKDSCMMMCATLFVAQYRRILARQGIES